jgi:D-sedoheptulose 7-phosphate isomerase
MSEDLEGLYPFLYAGAERTAGVEDEVRRSVVQKAAESVSLRASTGLDLAERVEACAEAMAAAFLDGATLYAFGNGGSSTDAADVVDTFVHPEPGGHLGSSARPLPARSLTGDMATITALSNDVGFEVVFARQLAAFARPGDIALGLSTSGGSANVLAGFAEARRRGLLTVGLAGYDGGPMAEVDTIDHLFVVQSSSVHRIQEVQTTIYHVLWELTQEHIADRTLSGATP